jgi:L-glyceraldehyde 3-phosphate reductase
LTTKYLDGVPADSRAAENGSLSQTLLTEENIARIQGLNSIAAERGQTLAQMALSWVLRDDVVTSVVIGASRWTQIEDCLGALENVAFSDDELAAIDEHAVESGINLWATSSDAR